MFYIFNNYQQQTFKTIDKYLNFTEDRYDIKSSDVYYIPQTNNANYFPKPSMLYFLKNGKYTTSEDVAASLELNCPPKKLFKEITPLLIDENLSINPNNKNFIVKQMNSGKFYALKENEITAVFLYSYLLGDRGQMYIKQKKILEKKGIKCLIVSVDGAYINEVKDISKDEIIIKRQ